MDSISSFGYWVRRRRKALDLTQATLARQVGCSVVTIRKIERDERRPSLQIAELLADQLNISEAERDKFLRMARGEFVVSMASPIEPIPVPPFLQAHDEASNREETPFVAREDELAQLDGFLELALARQGRVAFITGEAGRGKTALVQEFTRRTQETQADLVVAAGNCNAYSGVGDPYLPFREILGLLSGQVEARRAAGTISREQARRLWALMPYTIQALTSTGPDLVDIFVSGQDLLNQAAISVPDGGRWLAPLEGLVARHEATPGGSNVEQASLFEQYSKVLQVVAGQQPLLLVLDDLQWADSGSISLLFHLGRRLQGSPILIVGIYRPADVALGRDGDRHPLEPVVGEFRRQFGHIQVDLRQAENRQFVDEFLDTEPNRLGPEFRESLYRHTHGHALFTVEMIRGMQERGDLVQDEAGRWVEGSAVDWQTLPARVDGVIGERIGRLPVRLSELLKVASVEGESFTAEVIAQVLALDASEIIRLLSVELDRQHRLVMGQSSLHLEPGGQRLSKYRFRHILFQRYLYHSLDEPERGYLHETIGNTVEHLYGGQTKEVAVELARHFEQAGLLAKAVGYLQGAGNRAVRLSANEEAIAHFYRALALLETLPKTTELVRQELRLQIALIAPLAGAKGYGAPELKVVYTRAQELSEQAGEPGQMFLVLYGLWGHNLVSGELRTARELALQCFSLAQSIQDTAILMEAHRIMDETSLFRGELVSAREHLEQTLSLYDPQQHHAHATLYGQDPGVASFSHGSWILWHLGYPDQALKMGQEAVTLGENLSHPFSLAFALCLVATLYQMRRDVKKVEELVGTAITLSTEQGFVHWLAEATVLWGWVLANRGQREEGIARMHQGLADFKALHINLHLPYLLALLAEVYGDMGQLAEGQILLAEAMTLVEKGELRHFEAELYRLNGELLLMQGESLEEVEASFQRAIKIARQQEAKSLELRAAMSMSRLWAEQSKKEEARQMLAKIYDWFSEGFDTSDLIEAKALLEELG